MLSPDGACKSFDAGANGYVRADGAAAVVLCRSGLNREGVSWMHRYAHREFALLMMHAAGITRVLANWPSKRLCKPWRMDAHHCMSTSEHFSPALGQSLCFSSQARSFTLAGLSSRASWALARCRTGTRRRASSSPMALFRGSSLTGYAAAHLGPGLSPEVNTIREEMLDACVRDAVLSIVLPVLYLQG